MEDVLYELETRLKKLVENYQGVQQENTHLKLAGVKLNAEKDFAVEKNKKTIAQMEALVSHLKSIENLADE